jgi:hypothetical protein
MSVDREPFVFSDEQMTGFRQNITNLDQDVSPHVVNLTQLEIRRTYSMGKQAFPFVDETLKCAKEYPGFATSFFNLDKFEKDFVLSIQTGDLAKELAPVLEKLKETSMTAGSDAFAAARAYFQSVKAAAKGNKPGADAVVERLEKVFYKKTPKIEKEQPTEPTTPTSGE